jgi:hypothetical protein
MAHTRGGNKAAAAFRELSTRLNKGALKIGFLKGSTAPNGDSMPLRAAFNEFGVPSRNQPPRPFFRRMIAAKEKEWPAAVAGLLKSTKYDIDKTLNLTGEAIKGQLVESINTLVSPPLAQSTIDRKGFDKPLIDKADMVNSVAYEVKK